MYNTLDTLESVVRMIVADMHPIEIRELVDQLPLDWSEQLSAFCDRFDLGNWMYDVMTLNNIDLVNLLNQIASQFDQEIKEQFNEERLLAAIA